MQIVIDIHEKDYKSIMNRGYVSSGAVCAIMNGMPLPKGHGDLVDKNTLEGHYVCSIGLDEACVLKCECKDCSSGVYQLYDDIDKIPIVVRADRENE